MIAVSLIEQIVTNIKSTYSSMTGIDNLYVASVIDSARESVLNKRAASGDKTVPSQLLQYFDLYYDASIQPYNTDNSYTVYQMPRLAQISPAITAPVTVMKMKGVAYTLETSLQKYESIRRHNYSNQNEDVIVLVNNSAGDSCRLYGERKSPLRAQGVLAAPLSLETFNVMTDLYPSTGIMNSMIEAEIVSLYMRNLQAQAPRFVKTTGVQ